MVLLVGHVGGTAARLVDRLRNVGGFAVDESQFAPLLWVAPNAVRAGGPVPPRGRFVLRSDTFARLARLEVWQDGRRLATGVSFGMKPDRPVRLGASWTGKADPGGGPVTVRLA